MSLEILILAIQTRKPICFEYNRPNKTPGVRIGNPHAIFIFTSKAGEKSTKCHIVQTAGVSDTKEFSPLPDFRQFNIEDLTNVKILDDALSFEPFFEKYNPEWEGYRNVIEKI